MQHSEISITLKNICGIPEKLRPGILPINSRSLSFLDQVRRCGPMVVVLHAPTGQENSQARQNLATQLRFPVSPISPSGTWIIANSLQSNSATCNCTILLPHATFSKYT